MIRHVKDPDPVTLPVDPDTRRKMLDVSVPCRVACPVDTDIPGYIEATLKGDWETAWGINRRDNVFPGVLGRVCHRPCEAACRHARPEHGGEPVQICHLKRAAADFADAPQTRPASPCGKKVCVIGAGPAGLTVANDLALRGVQVKVLEQHDEPGGMLHYGIPEFRLPRDIVRRDIADIVALGVEIQTGARVDALADFEALRKYYDAVVLSGGCQLPTNPKLEGRDLEGVWYGLDYMMQANGGEPRRETGEVVVIGGGFTAVDCARTAQRNGASKVTLVYRRTESRMRVGPAETRALREEGIELEFLLSPLAIEGDDDHASQVRFVRNELSADGTPVALPAEVRTIECSTVILAIGQNQESLDCPDEEKAQWYVAGDFRNGSGTVVEAVADGRRVADEIATHLGLGARGAHLEVTQLTEEEFPRAEEWNAVLPPPMPLADLPHRTQTEQVEQGFSREQAQVEAQRCYLCHYHFHIDSSRCIYCMKCIDVMPTECISLVKGLVDRTDGRVAFRSAPDWNRADDIVIDHDACIRCGACAKVCPTQCIEIHRLERT